MNALLGNILDTLLINVNLEIQYNQNEFSHTNHNQFFIKIFINHRNHQKCYSHMSNELSSNELQ